MSDLSITSALNAINQTSSVSTSRITGTGATTGASTLAGLSQTGDSTSISPAGKLFSDLLALQQSDPAKFKSILSDISSKLTSAAQSSGVNADESNILNDLSSVLQQVSDTGDLSLLLPKKHHDHHAHKTQSAGGNQQTNLLQLLNNNTQQTTGTTSSSSIQDILSSLVSAISGSTSAATSTAV